MIILAIGHKSKQGKDTLAAAIVQTLRMQTRQKKIMKMGFADQLKSICYQLWGWTGLKDGDHYEHKREDRDIILPHINRSANQLWIDFGNYLRDFDGPVWINALLKGIQADVLVIKDLRFPNEAEAVKAAGGHMIHVTRPGFEGLNSDSDNALNDWLSWDEYFENKNGLYEFRPYAEYLVEKYCKRLIYER